MLKATQKMRVVLNREVSMFLNVKQIRNGIGDNYKCNAAIQKTLVVLERMRESGDVAVGLCADFEGFNVQMDLV